MPVGKLTYTIDLDSSNLPREMNSVEGNLLKRAQEMSDKAKIRWSIDDADLNRKVKASLDKMAMQLRREAGQLKIGIALEGNGVSLSQLTPAQFKSAGMGSVSKYFTASGAGPSENDIVNSYFRTESRRVLRAANDQAVGGLSYRWGRQKYGDQMEVAQQRELEKNAAIEDEVARQVKIGHDTHFKKYRVAERQKEASAKAGEDAYGRMVARKQQAQDDFEGIQDEAGGLRYKRGAANPGEEAKAGLGFLKAIGGTAGVVAIVRSVFKDTSAFADIQYGGNLARKLYRERQSNLESLGNFGDASIAREEAGQITTKQDIDRRNAAKSSFFGGWGAQAYYSLNGQTARDEQNTQLMAMDLGVSKESLQSLRQQQIKRAALSGNPLTLLSASQRKEMREANFNVGITGGYNPMAVNARDLAAVNQQREMGIAEGMRSADVLGFHNQFSNQRIAGQGLNAEFAGDRRGMLVASLAQEALSAQAGFAKRKASPDEAERNAAGLEETYWKFNFQDRARLASRDLQENPGMAMVVNSREAGGGFLNNADEAAKQTDILIQIKGLLQDIAGNSYMN